MAAREGTSLDELAERCVAALGDRPEIREIVAFGSYADGTADEFSDLDLRVVSEDWQLTVRCLPETLARVDDPVIMLLIGDSPDEAAWAVLFAHRPLWQKLDVGIQRPRRSGMLGVTRSLYRRPARASLPSVASERDVVVGDIPPGSALTHRLYDVVLGATRYVKYRRRGRPLTANRFYQPVLRTMLAVSYHAAGGRDLDAPFGSRDYPALDAFAGAALERYLYPRDAAHMDRLLVDALVRIVSMARPVMEREHSGRLLTIVDRVAGELGVRAPWRTTPA